ncbi:MAG: hypothetical protein JJT82_02600 [Legionellaceae bacterium]|nr:hypothetical protein [Legionellaceae bacterium]
MSKLRTAPAAQVAQPVPDGDAIQKALEVIENNPQSLAYFLQQAGDRIVPQVQQEIADIQKVVQKMRDFLEDGARFDGQDPPTPFQAFQHARQVSSIDDLQTVASEQQQVRMLCQVDEDAKMLRAYFLDGQLLKNDSEQGKQQIQKMDALVQAWMAENNIFYKNSVLYQADDNGKIQQDSQGQDIRLDAQDFMKKIEAPEGGLQAYLHASGLNAAVDSRTAPDPAVQHTASTGQSAAPSAAQAALPETPADAPSTKPRAEPQAEEPTASQDSTPGAGVS